MSWVKDSDVLTCSVFVQISPQLATRSYETNLLIGIRSHRHAVLMTSTAD
jgi:hypothetical protein